jgi:hypothetical protein
VRAAFLAGERMISLRLKGEYACAFLGQRPTFDAVEMQDPRMSGGDMRELSKRCAPSPSR